MTSSVEDFVQCMEEKVGGRGAWRASVLASFLPGLSSIVTRLIASDAKTTSLVVTQGLITWAHWVGVVMSGEDTPSEALRPPTSDPMLPERHSLLVERSEDWRRGTGERLQMLVHRVCVLVTSEAWRVRLFLVGWAHSLLTHCHR